MWSFSHKGLYLCYFLFVHQHEHCWREPENKKCITNVSVWLLYIWHVQNLNDRANNITGVTTDYNKISESHVQMQLPVPPSLCIPFLHHWFFSALLLKQVISMTEILSWALECNLTNHTPPRRRGLHLLLVCCLGPMIWTRPLSSS